MLSRNLTAINLNTQRPTQHWNPANVPGATTFSGDQACASCHQALVAQQQKSAMGNALETVADSAILASNALLTFRAGSYAYEIRRQGQQSIYTVTNGATSVSLPIRYVFGQGKAGQTYLLERDGVLYESRVSYYQSIKGLDFTVGAPTTEPHDLEQAIGRRLSKTDTLQCFNCHSTGAVSGGQLHIDKVTLGVRCELCHGPGGAHIMAMKAGQLNDKKIFNPSRLGGDELSQSQCAACHRGSEEYAELQRMGIQNVRFQPYRIFNSKCYSDDRRISCVACHDPHGNARHDATFYDAKCTACHQPTGGKAKAAAQNPRCRVGTKNCTNCHMPKVELPGAHFAFTDHRIRIARTGASYPK